MGSKYRDFKSEFAGF